MRRVISWLVIVFGVCPAFAGERVIDFSKLPVGDPPPGFRSVLSGHGKPGEWKVIIDSAEGENSETKQGATNTQVLAQLSQDATDERFPMLVLDDEVYGDFKLTTRFKMVDGLFEQMAGIAFRIEDTNSYYYVRASALGNTFRFIKLVKGQRLLTLGPSIEVPRGVWHELSIQCKGNRISALLNGKEVMETITDNTFTSGKIAFWTKSDSVSYFGRTTVTFTPHRTLAQHLVSEALERYPRLLGLRLYSLRGDEQAPTVIASKHADEVGQTGGTVERDVILRDVIYYGKAKKAALVTMPLHDRNGEVAGAVRVVLDSFPGQTEQNAVARARPVVKEMEARIRSAKDLLQ